MFKKLNTLTNCTDGNNENKDRNNYVHSQCILTTFIKKV